MTCHGPSTRIRLVAVYYTHDYVTKRRDALELWSAKIGALEISEAIIAVPFNRASTNDGDFAGIRHAPRAKCAMLHGTNAVLTTVIHRRTMRVPIVYTIGDRSMRDAAINLRAHLEQRDLIDQAAQLLGKNRSDFMLEAACDKARSVLLDQVFFELDAAKFRQFTKLLDAPPARSAGLERLMAVKAPWDKKPAKG